MIFYPCTFAGLDWYPSSTASLARFTLSSTGLQLLETSPRNAYLVKEENQKAAPSGVSITTQGAVDVLPGGLASDWRFVF